MQSPDDAFVASGFIVTTRSGAGGTGPGGNPGGATTISNTGTRLMKQPARLRDG